MRRNSFRSLLSKLVFLAGSLVLSTPVATLAAAAEGDALINARCAACHQRLPDGGLQRVGAARKTPEAWDMTLERMMRLHGVKLDGEERATLVKHLADTQGLAPSESAGFRYILERRSDVVEAPASEELGAMCGRCHSYARVGLQRRDRDEWLKLSHFHMGQYPTIEYQALARDRNWWDIATTRVPDELARLYPLATDAWRAWEAGQHRAPTGQWRMIGSQPGKGPYHGTLSVTAAGDDVYDIKLELAYDDGTQVASEGRAIVYTGYEWRARFDVDGKSVLQVAAIAEDGGSISGRWFYEDNDALGADMYAIRMAGARPRLLSVSPAYLRSGESAQVAVHGVGLEGAVSLGEGVEVLRTVSADEASVVVEARASGASGQRSVSVGGASADGLFTVYERLDAVRVVPPYTIARVGAAGGPLAAVPAQFDAIGYLNGADGEAGTDDDVRVGVMPATWSVSDYNEVAAATRDAQYAGNMQANGLFVPAGAGLNPERVYSTNNVGDLRVEAAVDDAGTTVTGDAHLVVTVQRWIDPPIR